MDWRVILGRAAAVGLVLALLAGCGGSVDAQPIEDTTYIDPTTDVGEAVVAANALGETRWRLIFSDEFNGAWVNPTRWRVVDQELNSNGAVNNYNPAMVCTIGGFLHLQVKPIPWKGKPYSGGEIDTLDRPAYTYGLFQARIKAASGSGLHTSFWLWPDNNVWPPEIDMIELRGNQPTRADLTLHWPDPAYVGDYHPYDQSSFYGPDFSQGWHEFTVDWSPERIIWYVDGIERKRMTEHIPTTPMRLEVDLALDAYAGGIDATTLFPATTLVDWVRVFTAEMPASPAGLEIH